MQTYKTVYRGGQGEIEEKKSRFIATVRWATNGPEEALVPLWRRKKKE
ncbi:MAG: hypothetical protein V8R80_07950 [Eubacterium sp.]